MVQTIDSNTSIAVIKYFCYKSTGWTCETLRKVKGSQDWTMVLWAGSTICYEVILQSERLPKHTLLGVTNSQLPLSFFFCITAIKKSSTVCQAQDWSTRFVRHHLFLKNTHSPLFTVSSSSLIKCKNSCVSIQTSSPSTQSSLLTETKYLHGTLIWVNTIIKLPTILAWANTLIKTGQYGICSVHISRNISPWPCLVRALCSRA